jgi:hypothetical protein
MIIRRKLTPTFIKEILQAYAHSWSCLGDKLDELQDCLWTGYDRAIKVTTQPNGRRVGVVGSYSKVMGFSESVCLYLTPDLTHEFSISSDAEDIAELIKLADDADVVNREIKGEHVFYCSDDFGSLIIDMGGKCTYRQL